MGVRVELNFATFVTITMQRKKEEKKKEGAGRKKI